ERVVGPSSQILLAVTVEVAGNGEADHVRAGQHLIDLEVMVGIEEPGVTYLERYFVAIGGVAVKVASHRCAIDVGNRSKQGLDDVEVRLPIVVGVDQPAIVRADLAVGRQLVKAVRNSGFGRDEVAGKDVVAGEAHHVNDVAVDSV